MDAARKWLETGNALGNKTSIAKEKLGSDEEIIKCAIAHIKEIQQTLPTALPDGLLSVAVDDIKVLTALMKLVVVYGIYRYISNSEMVPLQPRVPLWQLPEKTNIVDTRAEVTQLSEEILSILRKKNDVTGLIIISPFTVDLLALMQRNGEQFLELISMIPTFNLYKLLIQLRTVESPSILVVKTLGEMILHRQDAVRTMIELVTESSNSDGTIDLTHIDKAVVAFKSPPQGVQAKLYIEALGNQLFNILCTKPSSTSQKLIEATSLIVAKLADAEPKILGRLRNRIIEPFIYPRGVFGNSSGVIMNLIDATQNNTSHFVVHIISKILSSLWLLICTSAESSEGIDSSLLTLIVQCLDYDPHTVKTLAPDFKIKTIPPRLSWSVVSGSEPKLVDSILKPIDDISAQGDIGNHSKKRAEIFVTVVRHLKDKNATSILGSLLALYTSSGETNELTDIMSKLVLAKVIEGVAQDGEIKPKLFNSPQEVVDFSFAQLKFFYERLQSQSHLTLGSQHHKNFDMTDKFRNLDVGDSDDEDESDAEISGSNEEITTEGDNAMLELVLSLLSGALMEVVGDADFEAMFSTEHKECLKVLSSHEKVSKTIRARADFCFELVTGKLRNDTVVDFNNDESVKTAAYDALREPLVPSRAYGIHLISKLVAKKAIPLNQAFEVFASELGDEESYIYLNVIKAIEETTKVYSTVDVVEYLLPLIGTENNEHVDRALRAREALIRLITPGSAQSINNKILESLMNDLSASSRNTQDIRLRLSSASIIGIIFAQFPLSVIAAMQSDAVDCVIGILRHEKDDNNVALHRAVVVMGLEIVNAVNEGAFTNIPKEKIESISLEIRSLMDNTDDDILKDHCNAVLGAACI